MARTEEIQAEKVFPNEAPLPVLERPFPDPWQDLVLPLPLCLLSAVLPNFVSLEQ